MYQPSVCIFVFALLHESGDETVSIVIIKCLAVKPNICLRSPESFVVIVVVTRPPAWTTPFLSTTAVLFPAGCVPSLNGLTMYIFVCELSWMLRRRSHCVRLIIMPFIDSLRCRLPLM